MFHLKTWHYIILQTLSCGRDIDADKFGEYAMETYNRIVELYAWYKMPWSVHRILMHGAQTIVHKKLIKVLLEINEFKSFRKNNIPKPPKPPIFLTLG